MVDEIKKTILDYCDARGLSLSTRNTVFLRVMILGTQTFKVGNWLN